MKAEHINPFINGSQSVIAMVCGENVTIGKTSLKGAPYACGAASVAVTMQGEITGNIIYTMELPSACAIASRMMGGMAVTALDDMTSSALTELTNMISGNAATVFSGQGLKVTVSAPVFRANAASGDFPFVQPGAKIICVPLVFQDGSIFEIDIVVT